jgi:hypothetical protein
VAGLISIAQQNGHNDQFCAAFSLRELSEQLPEGDEKTNAISAAAAGFTYFAQQNGHNFQFLAANNLLRLIPQLPEGDEKTNAINAAVATFKDGNFSAAVRLMELSKQLAVQENKDVIIAAVAAFTRIAQLNGHNDQFWAANNLLVLILQLPEGDEKTNAINAAKAALTYLKENPSCSWEKKQAEALLQQLQQASLAT